MNQIATSIIVRRTPSHVFGFVADLKNHAAFPPKHYSDLRVTSSESRGVGARMVFDLQVAGRKSALEHTIVEMVEAKRVVLATGEVGGSFRIEWSFHPVETPAGEGTNVRVGVEYRPVPGLIGALFDALIVRRKLRGDYQTQLRRLRQVMEGSGR